VLILGAIARPPVVSLREYLEFMFRCAVVLLFAIYLYRDINKYAGLFLMLALFSHSVPGLILSGFKQLQTDQSYIALNMVAAGCGLYALIIAKCLKVDRLLDALCVIAISDVLALIYMQQTLNPLNADVSRASGIFANPNESAACLAMCGPAFFRRYWVFFLPGILLGLGLSKSSGGVIGFASAAVLFMIVSKPGWVALISGCAIMAGLALFVKYIDQPCIRPRWELWQKAISISIINQPFLGFGLGNWAAIYPGLLQRGAFPQGWVRLHNSFIQGFVEMGVLFPIIILGYVASIVRRVTSTVAMPLAAMAAIVAGMITNSMFRMSALNAMIAVVWLAIMEIMAGRNNGILHTK